MLVVRYFHLLLKKQLLLSPVLHIETLFPTVKGKINYKKSIKYEKIIAESIKNLKSNWLLNNVIFLNYFIILTLIYHHEILYEMSNASRKRKYVHIVGIEIHNYDYEASRSRRQVIIHSLHSYTLMDRLMYNLNPL